MTMRKIKFRGKRIDTGEWVYGNILQWTDGTVDIAPIDRDNIQHTVNPDTVGQYTGLKDRTGNDVFEGDLLRTFEDDIMVVKWVGGGFITSCLKPAIAGLINTNRYAYPVSEVIGNIHDNPELLEEVK